MPKRTVNNIDYYLLLLNENGEERLEADGTRLSETLAELVTDGVTDVFLTSHGWKGDIPAAISQYDRWIGVMAGQQGDRAQAHALVPDFKALTIGIHWPSLPWGDERVESAVLGGETEFDELADEREMTADQLVDRYAERIADTPKARQALTTITSFAVGEGDLQSETDIPPALEAAYQALFTEAGLTTQGVAAAPGADQVEFAPADTANAWMKALGNEPGADTGGPGVLGGFLSKLRDRILSPLRQVSFWAMKNRARNVGERDVHKLIATLQSKAPHARFHLMGHSFGCIVMTAAVAGPSENGQFVNPLPRPVDSLFLVQGAMSLWSFADAIPFEPNPPGYFKPICLAPRQVAGPIVTTQSSHDGAVGTFFPIGAKLGDDLTLGPNDLPKFGGIGTFGIQGTGQLQSLTIQSDTAAYNFAPGNVYNVDASSVISVGAPPSGAHSDIVYPAVAHIFWQAVLSGIGNTL